MLIAMFMVLWLSVQSMRTSSMTRGTFTMRLMSYDMVVLVISLLSVVM